MQKWRQSRFANPATWYLIAGFALLVISLWVPWATAERTARIERRADDIAALLIEAANAFPDDLDAADARVVFARFLRLAARDRIIVSDLEPIEPPLPGTLLLLQNKHYAFHLAVSPPPQDEVVGPDTMSAREVMAWPLTATGPAHCAFFHPDDGPRAFTRNLNAGYADLGDKRPLPGRSHPVPRVREIASYYRSADDERWILY